MSITITGDKMVRNHLNRIEKAISITPKRLVKIAGEARNMIRDRTNKAQSFTGSPFKTLNQVYADRKAKKGKQPIPNLHWSGNLLNSMQVKGIKDGAEIYFNTAESKVIAEAHHFGKGQPRRSFFKLGKKIREYIFKEVHKPIKKAV